MIGDAHIKIRQTNQKTLYGGFTMVKKSPKINSNAANNFSSDVRQQLLIANDRNRVRWLALGLSRDGACIDLYENHSENSLKGDLSIDTTVNPPLFSLVNTFNSIFLTKDKK
jgi:hypothetical protein